MKIKRKRATLETWHRKLAGIPKMYQLGSSSGKNLFKDSGTSKQEKTAHNVYLAESHWSALDREAEKRGISRNAVLRNILDSVLGGQ
ncbi:MAG: hypothetical protein ABEJ95_06175 [Candidatus Nanohalobium sp.]